MHQSKCSARNLLREGLRAAVLCAAAVTAHAASTATVDLPPITQPPSGEQHVGKVIWVDLVAPDLDNAKRFYGALFGWTFRDAPGAPDYALALLDGEPVAGLFQKALPAGQSKQPAFSCRARRGCRAAGGPSARWKGAIQSTLLSAPRPSGGAARS